jgi:hypothetical protein
VKTAKKSLMTSGTEQNPMHLENVKLLVEAGAYLNYQVQV